MFELGAHAVPMVPVPKHSLPRSCRVVGFFIPTYHRVFTSGFSSNFYMRLFSSYRHGRLLRSSLCALFPSLNFSEDPKRSYLKVAVRAIHKISFILNKFGFQVLVLLVITPGISSLHVF